MAKVKPITPSDSDWGEQLGGGQQMRILILDDMETRHQEFDRVLMSLSDVEIDHVQTSMAAIRHLRNRLLRYDLVCLDHDLNDEIPKGMRPQDYDGGDGGEVAEFIALHLEKSQYPRAILIHSHNDKLAKLMQARLIPTQIPITLSEFTDNMDWLLGLLKGLK